ncbi:MAG: hypothetical protein HQM00_02335 [Magnetococcales bacterium]|nr:hypothetical protein [Magnetococcales bacterium]
MPKLTGIGAAIPMIEKNQNNFSQNQLQAQNAQMMDIRGRSTPGPMASTGGAEIASQWGARQRESMPMRPVTTDAQAGTGRYGDANSEIGNSIVAKMIGTAQSAYGARANAGMQSQQSKNAADLANQNARQIGTSILAANKFGYDTEAAYQGAGDKWAIGEDAYLNDLAKMNVQQDGDLAFQAQQAAIKQDISESVFGKNLEHQQEMSAADLLAAMQASKGVNEAMASAEAISLQNKYNQQAQQNMRSYVPTAMKGPTPSELAKKAQQKNTLTQYLSPTAIKAVSDYLSRKP